MICTYEPFVVTILNDLSFHTIRSLLELMTSPDVSLRSIPSARPVHGCSPPYIYEHSGSSGTVGTQDATALLLLLLLQHQAGFRIILNDSNMLVDKRLHSRVTGS